MRIIDVRPLAGYGVALLLDDDTTREVDLTRLIEWGEIYEPLRTDRSFFEQVFVDPVGHTIAWPNGADVAPEILLGLAEPAPPRHR